jgi:hypothetical protein
LARSRDLIASTPSLPRLHQITGLRWSYYSPTIALFSNRRVEPGRAAAEYRRSSTGPNGTAESRRAAARGFSPGFARGFRNAGPAFGYQQHLVDAELWGWVVRRQWLVTRLNCLVSTAPRIVALRGGYNEVEIDRGRLNRKADRLGTQPAIRNGVAV